MRDLQQKSKNKNPLVVSKVIYKWQQVSKGNIEEKNGKSWRKIRASSSAEVQMVLNIFQCCREIESEEEIARWLGWLKEKKEVENQ